MMLWIILTAMMVIAAVGLTILLVRSHAEAEGLRANIKRRILAEGPESESRARPVGGRSPALLALGFVVIILLGSVGLYLNLGRPGLPSASTAGERGLNVAGQSPPAAPASAAADVSPPSASTPGEPTPDQMASVSQMPAGDQQVMIHKMVDGLAARLKASPRDPDGWLRLMRARMVLNQPEAAKTAYYDALKAYADTPGQQQAFRDAALELGIPGI
jgi:cytochrome c-type biogenesis protein CcmH/NrfG